jgi:hypothetical protein
MRCPLGHHKTTSEGHQMSLRALFCPQIFVSCRLVDLFFSFPTLIFIFPSYVFRCVLFATLTLLQRCWRPFFVYNVYFFYSLSTPRGTMCVSCLFWTMNQTSHSMTVAQATPIPFTIDIESDTSTDPANQQRIKDAETKGSLESSPICITY